MKSRSASTWVFLGVLANLIAVGCGGSYGSLHPVSVVITSPASAPSIQQGQTVSITASVSYDSSSKGITWSLTGQGSLTNQTSTSVTYNAPALVSSNIMATVTATSVADPSKSASITITVQLPPPHTVIINTKISSLAAAITTPVQFTATVENDPSNSGVTWMLAVNGAACSPACGTLSQANIFGVFYTPPSSVPAAPNNSPTITATSVADPTKSDSDTFNLFEGATACGAGGNESALIGEYAILLQGWSGGGTGTPMTFAASFGADGTGKITRGVVTINNFTMSLSGGGIVASASSYSVGPDNRGCLTLTNYIEDMTFSFHFSLGGISGGVASKGDIIEFDNPAGTIEFASGILRLQDPSSFSLSGLAANYAFGVDGWKNSSGSRTHFAQVGSFAQSGGSISSPSFDANDGGKLTSSTSVTPGNFGTIDPISTTTGYATASISLLPGQSGPSSNVVIYVINSSEIFIISLNISANGGVVSGRAIASSSSFSASSVSPNYIFRTTGSSSGNAAASIGLASFSGGISGTVSGTVDQYSGGTPSNQILTGTYGLDLNSGRMSISGATAASSPILYLTNPSDGISAFSISADASATLGIFDVQPAATYSNTSLSGNFFFGSNEPGVNTVPDVSAVASISSGNMQGTKDESAAAGFSLGTTVNATLSINADGSGNLGANSVAVTNGKTLYYINEAGGAPPEVLVFEQ